MKLAEMPISPPAQKSGHDRIADVRGDRGRGVQFLVRALPRETAKEDAPCVLIAEVYSVMLFEILRMARPASTDRPVSGRGKGHGAGRRARRWESASSPTRAATRSPLDANNPVAETQIDPQPRERSRIHAYQVSGECAMMMGVIRNSYRRSLYPSAYRPVISNHATLVPDEGQTGIKYLVHESREYPFRTSGYSSIRQTKALEPEANLRTKAFDVVADFLDGFEAQPSQRKRWITS